VSKQAFNRVGLKRLIDTYDNNRWYLDRDLLAAISRRDNAAREAEHLKERLRYHDSERRKYKKLLDRLP
jgi:hypothetical protein